MNDAGSRAHEAKSSRRWSSGAFAKTVPVFLAVAIDGATIWTVSAYASPPAATLPEWQPGPAGDLAFETSDFLRLSAYRKPDDTAKDIDANGAYGPLNRAWDETGQGRWLIEEQRYAFNTIVAGILYHRQDIIAAGEKVFDWGFRQEQPDGSFQCPDRFHSMSFFVEAAAHSALLLQASDMQAQNQLWVDSAKPRLRQSVRWMMDPANAVPGQAHDAPYTHRFYLDADAIGETGVLLHDNDMIRESRSYVRRGIRHQDIAGFNPEKTGWDTSYHVVGLLFALDYYTLVADDAMRRDMQPMISNGFAWFARRIRPDGTVDQTGNTRTGFGQERGPQGNLKKMSYGSAYRAAYYWAMITKNTEWARVAQLLYNGQHVEEKEQKLQ